MLKIDRFKIINTAVILGFIFLPYYLFQGKLYIGGDDTRLLYSYPFEFLKNSAFFSWSNFSSIGANNPGQYSIPFLTTWSILDLFIKNKIIISYLAFSLPLILGFVFFQKLVKEIFSFKDDEYQSALLGSIFYVLSPILIIDQLFIFLTTIWLLAVIPAVGYYYICYVKRNKFIDVYKAMLMAFIFSFAFLSVPWLLGFLIPLLIGSPIVLIFNERGKMLSALRKSIIFIFALLASQIFWLIGFLFTYLTVDKTSFATKLSSREFLSTFALTVSGTATSYIIYPLLNLFHRRIAFDFSWKLADDFLRLYDKIIFLDAIYILLFFGGLLYYKKYLNRINRRLYLFFFTSFLASLYLFTVNIGPLKDLFYQFGNIPGFIMFRNFYDKFAPGYVFIYAIVVTISLVVLGRKFNKFREVAFWVILGVILLNFSAVKSTVNSPLWTTENIYKNITIPREYLNFMDQISNKFSASSAILEFPYGSTSYTVIKDQKSNNVYVGLSPVQLFSGIGDLSGAMSFNLGNDAEQINDAIINRKYDFLNKILFKHNVNYVLVTNNIPNQVLNSYIFNKQVLEKEDRQFLNAITGKLIFKSENGNYQLYSSKKQNNLISSRSLSFKKINPVMYQIRINKINKQQKLYFNDTYHSGWTLYLQKYADNKCLEIKKLDSIIECKKEFSFLSLNELSFLWKKSIFNSTHTNMDGSNNSWNIDASYIKNNYDKTFYKENKDGSIDVNLTLYFKPQLSFYYGSIVTGLIFLFATIYLIKDRKDND